MSSRNLFIGLVLAASCLFVFQYGWCTAVLTLRDSVDVKGADISLADVVVESLDGVENQIIAKSPPWGSEKVLTANFIKHRLKDLGVNLTGASRVVVTRKTLQRGREVFPILWRLVEKKFRRTKWFNKGDSLSVEFVKFPESLKLPPGEFVLECELPSSISGYQVVSFTVSTRDGFIRRFSTGCKFHVITECAVALRNLEKGEPIRDGDLDWVRKDLSNCYEPPVTSRLDLDGKRPNRFIKKGHLVPLRALECIPDVKKGETVFVEISRGCLVVSARGRSLEDGWVGDRILVRNLVSGKVERYVVQGGVRVTPASRGIEK